MSGYSINQMGWRNLTRTYRMFTEVNRQSGFIEIVDNLVLDGRQGQGYGSKVMQEFLNIAKVVNVRKIVGTLSLADEIDANNKARRNHYYEKYGFTIEGDKILKELY